MKYDDLKLTYDSVLLSPSEVSETAKSIKDYVGELQEVVRSKSYVVSESSINLVSDQKMISEVEAVVREKKTSELKYVINIGIGGSSLGTSAVYEATKTGYPGLLSADTVNPVRINRILRVIERSCQKPEELLVTIVSKSGKTTEVITNAEILLAALEDKFGVDILLRVVVISNEGSGLWNAAFDKKITKLTIPKMVGGR
ncbi:MAG: hypothetical protein O2794_01745, partial [bacterium]|nr:hypothetical protein [bacterium]